MNQGVPVFSIQRQPQHLQVASSDTVTAVAATGGLLWIGTKFGRLIRYNTHNKQVHEVRGRLGVGRLDNAVWRIYADPSTHSALIILRNADGYHALASGPVRPRWLARLRGLRCVSASWIRDFSTKRVRNVALLGTTFGALFSLKVDEMYEKDDVLVKLWSAPNAEKIDGIRVEHVAGKFIGTVATTNALYLFSDASSLQSLFQEDHMTVVNRCESVPNKSQDQDTLLPSELHFLSGSSGLASRRFVWASSLGVTQAQLAVRRRTAARSSDAELDAQAPSQSTVAASVIDKKTIPWSTLKEKSGSAVPLAVNLSAFHVLVLYPGSLYAYNQISGELTQNLTIWSPEVGTESSTPTSAQATQRRMMRSPKNISAASRRQESNIALDWRHKDEKLSTPATGFVRDVADDTLWIYTGDGEFAKMISSNEEQTDAWKAAKAVGRFDIAMALAPFVFSGVQDDTVVLQTREAVLEAQADHAAAEGNWDAAAQLYAKTERPIERVILDIMCGVASQTAEKTSSLRNLGIGSHLQTTKHITTYLVRKLDRTDLKKPMQRTILTTLLVQLYSSQLFSELDLALREEIAKDFTNFLADRYNDLDTNSALSILLKNGCHEEASDLAIVSKNLLFASELSSRHGQVEQSIRMLSNQILSKDHDLLRQLIYSMAISIIPLAPRKVAAALSRVAKEEGHRADHIVILHELAKIAREAGNEEKSREAYQSACTFMFDLLRDCKAVSDMKPIAAMNPSSALETSSDWCHLATLLFQLHAELGTEEDAQRSFDHILAPRTRGGLSNEMRSALGAILRSSMSAGFNELCVLLYRALGLHRRAVSEAVTFDARLAEDNIAQLSLADMSLSDRRSLWRLVASQSHDPIAVVERSKGILCIEDVLISMSQFESATERIKTAVACSLKEHKSLASAAKSEASSALEMTNLLREDLHTARRWQAARSIERPRLRSNTFSCGHRVSAASHGATESSECALCGNNAIESLDAAFESGHTLPITAVQERVS